MQRTNRHLLLLLLLLTAGCAKPSGDYLFVSSQTARAQGGSYDFQLNLDDSTCCYATMLAARIVSSRIPAGQFALNIRTTSPTGEITIERLALPLSGAPGEKTVLGSGSLIDCQWPWRTLPSSGQEHGIWQISITPTDPALAEAFYGIGISYQARTWEKEN